MSEVKACNDKEADELQVLYRRLSEQVMQERRIWGKFEDGSMGKNPDVLGDCCLYQGASEM